MLQLEDSKSVESYLRKFEVEEAVQAAVNSAILHKAADPILHIADFLENLGRQHDESGARSEAVASSAAAEQTAT